VLQVFSGRHDHALDDKGRSMVPKQFRNLLNDLGQTSLIVTVFPGEQPYLEAWTVPAFRARERELNALSRANPSAALRRFKRMFVGHASEVPLDKAGRLLVSPELRAMAGLEDRITFLGVGEDDFFELWRPESLAAEHAYCAEHSDEIFAALTPAAAATGST